MERAWRRVAVHPQPGTTLLRAEMAVPTLRGAIDFAFARQPGPRGTPEGGSFALNLTIPGNTRAEVCLPAPLLGSSPALTLNGQPVEPRRPPDRPGHVCLPQDIGGGVYSVLAR